MKLSDTIKGIRNFIPRKNERNYCYQLKDDDLRFEDGVEILESKFKKEIHLGWIDYTNTKNIDWICSELGKIGLIVAKIQIKKDEYNNYLNQAKYNEKYGNYYEDNFYEKSLEHFLSYKLLGSLPSLS